MPADRDVERNGRSQPLAAIRGSSPAAAQPAPGKRTLEPPAAGEVAKGLEVSGTPSVEHYDGMLAAVLAARDVTECANPGDMTAVGHLRRLLEPVAVRLNQLNDHQGRLAQFGAGNVAGQASLDMSEAAVRSWLQLVALHAKVRTDELVTRFRMGAEVIRFLTGEQTDAPTLRAFDRASRTSIELGAAAMVLGPPIVAVAAEAALPLAVAARVASQRVVLWAIQHPAAALAASEALFALGVQVGEDGWLSLWDQLRDPRGRWFLILQVLMDYMHVKSGMSHGSRPPRAPGEAPGMEPNIARQQAERVRIVVQQVSDAAALEAGAGGAASRSGALPVPREPAPGPSGRSPAMRGVAVPDAAAVERWASEQTAQVHALLELPIPPAAKAELSARWQRIREVVAHLNANPHDLATQRRLQAELQHMQRAASGTLEGARPNVSRDTAQRNWQQASSLVATWARERDPLTLDRIKQLHGVVDADLSDHRQSGELRTGNASAGGRVSHMYMSEKDVPAQMSGFVTWYRKNQSTMPPIELAARAYQRLVSIHPFGDGNGRTCRLVMDWILQQHGLPAPVFHGAEHNVAVFWSDAYNGGGVTPEQATRNVTAAIERALVMLNPAGASGGQR